jgi:hypothetical protein
MPLSPQGRNTTPVEPFPDYDVADGEIVPVPRPKALVPNDNLPVNWVERVNACTWATEENAAISIANRILSGATAEDVGAELAGRSVTQMGLVGVPFIITGFSFTESSYEKGPGVFANVEAAFEDGEIFSFSVGGWGPIPQLVRWNELGAFPVKVKIIQIASKDAGKNPAMRFVLV